MLKENAQKLEKFNIEASTEELETLSDAHVKSSSKIISPLIVN